MHLETFEKTSKKKVKSFKRKRTNLYDSSKKKMRKLEKRWAKRIQEANKLFKSWKKAGAGGKKGAIKDLANSGSDESDSSSSDGNSDLSV